MSETKKRVYSGFIYTDGYGMLRLLRSKYGSKYGKYSYELIKEIEDDWASGESVFVRYFLSEEKLTEEQAIEAQISTFSGSLDVKYELNAYSEWTILSSEEIFSVGGHDLVSELSDNEGKFLLLIIESPTKDQGEAI